MRLLVGAMNDYVARGFVLPYVNSEVVHASSPTVACTRLLRGNEN